MRYVTISELSDMIRRNLWKIPHDIDLVVGIPRSGLMVANMIALYLNKQLSDIESFVDGRVFSIGNSRRHMMNNTPIRKVLVVDDSVGSGGSMNEAKRKLQTMTSNIEYFFFAPIVTSEGGRFVDQFIEVIDETRIFEWNLFHHWLLEYACFDLDGVLCCDPPNDDDGIIYSDYINNAIPLYIPTAKIGCIVTCRLEKYRTQTEDWLAKHNIKYNELVMLNMPDKAARVKWGKHGEFKGSFYKKSNYTLFIESSLFQAQTIVAIAKKDVICIESNSLIAGTDIIERVKKKKCIQQLFSAMYRLTKQK